MSWSDLSDWWLDEIGDDPAYEIVVTPLLLEILDPVGEASYLDLGSGQGRIMQAVAASGARVHGIELSETLARKSGPLSIVAQLPEIPVRNNSADGACAVLVIEHLPDHMAFFIETARVVRSGGVLAVVTNHPVWTAPDSSPITDTDGEILWRPGEYFSGGTTDVTAGEGIVTFHHRTMSVLLNAAAVSVDYQGNRLGERLLADAVQRVVKTSDSIGIALLAVDALDGRQLASMRSTVSTAGLPTVCASSPALETLLRHSLADHRAAD